ncbi:hypothetical protein CEQ90_04695 [Lewinellaceae bacterium SD302]|nr:hypothetical protein CEQ90_04695 [Lewinellaceae bacterium SD302]
MAVIRRIENFVAFIGRSVAWLNVLLILLIIVDVILRAVLDLTAVWVTEVQWHLFSLIFLLGAPYALQEDRHVRVDLFYERFSAKDRATVDLWGTLIFLIPWSILLMVTGSQYAYEAWLSGEGSPNPGGLPTFVPIKLMIPFSALLLLLQGLALAWKNNLLLREENTAV